MCNVYITLMYIRGCSNFCIILRTELQVPYRSGINAAKFQRKIMTATPRQMPFYVCTETILRVNYAVIRGSRLLSRDPRRRAF